MLKLIEILLIFSQRFFSEHPFVNQMIFDLFKEFDLCKMLLSLLRIIMDHLMNKNLQRHVKILDCLRFSSALHLIFMIC